MIRRLRLAVLAAVVVSTGVVAPAGAQQPPARADTLRARPEPAPARAGEQVLPPGDTAVPPFQVIVHCSETELRTGLATLIWPAERADLGRQRVDVTVYGQGFERGYFATLFPIEREGRFQPTPELERQQVGSALNLVVDKLELEREGFIALQVKPLAPGVYYVWRVLTRAEEERWFPGETVSTQAPTCVADIIGGALE